MCDRQTEIAEEAETGDSKKKIMIIAVYLLSDRSVLFPTSMIMTSLPLSVRTSSIHLDVWWKELASAKQKINCMCVCVCVCVCVCMCVHMHVYVCMHNRVVSVCIWF